ncbi:hypothetical protein CYY_002098 [Polysphondylium violaceum]|uniref:Glutathione S-transferase n=1 Tax=Polysphondylium violaceum TaxID=133409 RepID=A0A8J4Q0S2_9MYCE|nr:hypothetical protein CYY_002098 [Polysphondylium violaceum]
MSQATLTYFNGRGKGEQIRLIHKYLDIPFVDHRVNEIGELKPKLPYGQLPIYEDGQVLLAQSSAIARYIANKNNFAGKNVVEKALADEVVDGVADVHSLLFSTAKDRDAKIQTFPKFYNHWEKKLTQNKHIAGGDDYTFADISLYFILDYVNFFGFPDAIKEYPKLQEHLAYFNSHPKFAEYLKSRPESKF